MIQGAVVSRERCYPLVWGHQGCEYSRLLPPPFPSSHSEATLFSQFACQLSPCSPTAASPMGVLGLIYPLLVLTCPRSKASSVAGVFLPGERSSTGCCCQGWGQAARACLASSVQLLPLCSRRSCLNPAIQRVRRPGREGVLPVSFVP